MALLRLSVRGLGLVSTIILARLLVPADFGLVAMATSIVAFLELATAFSFDIPLIQNQNTDRRHFDTAWTLNLLFYTGLTVLLLALAQPASAFYQDSRLAPIIYVLAAGFAVKGFENIGVVNFRKNLEFRKEFWVMFSRKLAGFVVAVPLAFYLRSYWALVLGIVTGNVVGVIFTYAVHPFRPRLAMSHAGEMLRFSKWLVLNNGINFIRMRSPDFIIGRISGSSSLGLFSIAYEIATLPTTELVAPVNRVVFPGYSKLAGNLPLLRDSYVDVLSIVAMLAFPASVGIVLVAEPLVSLFLGEKWLAATPLITTLALFGGINAIQTNTGSIFNARGRPELITVVGIINIIVLLLTAIPLAIKFGPSGVAVAYVVTFTLLAPVTYFFVCREINLPASRIVGALWRPLGASIVMYFAVRRFSEYVSTVWDPATGVVLAMLVGVGCTVYAAISLLLWTLSGRPRSPEYRLIMVLLRRLHFQRNIEAI